jgi:hypothetical protein
VKDGTPRRPVVSRGELPRERLAQIAKGMQDSPLKETLERLALPPRTRSKPES